MKWLFVENKETDMTTKFTDLLTQQTLIKVWLSFSLDSIIYSLKAMNPPLLLFSCELKYQYNLCWVLMQKTFVKKK